MDELEKLALVIPSQPLDAEARHDRATAELLAQMLPQEFDCTCVQPNLKAALQPRSEDKNAPTYTQRSYALWRRTLPSPAEAFDAALAMDGLHPWALAALEGLNAKRRYVWLCDLPEDYLLPEDIPFFAEHYAALTGIFCASEAIREDFGRLFPSLAPKSTVIALPLDTAYYQQLSRETEEPWGAGTADILAVCRLDSDNDAQQIPQLAARWKVKKPELRRRLRRSGAVRPAGETRAVDGTGERLPVHCRSGRRGSGAHGARHGENDIPVTLDRSAAFRHGSPCRESCFF